MYNKLNAALITVMAVFCTVASATGKSGEYPAREYYPGAATAIDIHGPGPDTLINLTGSERGPECPVGSGEYCAATSNHCCLINNVWTCVTELKDCKDN